MQTSNAVEMSFCIAKKNLSQLAPNPTASPSAADDARGTVTLLHTPSKNLHGPAMHACPQVVVGHELAVHIPFGLLSEGLYMDGQGIHHGHKRQLEISVNAWTTTGPLPVTEWLCMQRLP
jgi:hypothetical protein